MLQILKFKQSLIPVKKAQVKRTRVNVYFISKMTTKHDFIMLLSYFGKHVSLLCDIFKGLLELIKK